MWVAVLVPVSGWIYAMGFPLRAVFSLLFCIAQNKDALVADFLCWQNGVAHWDVCFTRSVHDWELVSLQDRLGLLYSRQVDRDQADCICWLPCRSGLF